MDRHDSKSGQFFVHICYNVTNYMEPKTAKLSRLKFVPLLIMKWRIRKCQYFDPKLPTFAVANSYTKHLIYVLIGTQNSKIKQIGAKKQINFIIFIITIFVLFLRQVCNQHI